MQFLKELTYVIQKGKIRSTEDFGTKNENLSRVDELYEGLVHDRFKNDDEAAAKMYGEGADKYHSGYQKLKGKLKHRLIDHLFLIETWNEAFTDRQNAFYTCQKEWAAANILIGRNTRKAGISLAHNILKQAKRFEFTDLVVDVAKTLRLHYGTREGNLVKFEKYNKIFHKYNRIKEQEDLAEELYTSLIIRYVNNKATKTEINEKAKEYVELLKEPLAKYDTYRLHLCGRLMQILIHTSVNDYKSTVKVCEDSLRFFYNKNYTANIPLQICHYQLIVCHIQLKQYQQGKKAAEDCLAFQNEGSFNWFKYQELYLILSMHTQQYQQAYKIFLQTVNHRRFQGMPENLKEMWRIFEAYLHYLVDNNKVRPEADDNRFNKFRLGKFLNNTPIFSRDKRGMNIPILIIQILFMMNQQKYSAAVDKIEAIEKYCSRYLTKNDTFRSNCLIKMLLQIPICSFHRVAVERKTAKYLEKLQEVPLEVAKQTHEIEIIPYENLWQMAISSMGHTFYKTQNRRANISDMK
ncbi:MAG: hypothetical protein DHS20C18_31410 [Saprospiraceae bacterium]|nr:MAG: hypothetical protein DHS20C18_31410 [Saprospiraceae bacterium]